MIYEPVKKKPKDNYGWMQSEERTGRRQSSKMLVFAVRTSYQLITTNVTS